MRFETTKDFFYFSKKYFLGERSAVNLHLFKAFQKFIKKIKKKFVSGDAG